MLAAEASWEPLEGTASGQVGVAFLMAAKIAIFLHTFFEHQLKVGMKNAGIPRLTN
jgi:hypothetical protein